MIRFAQHWNPLTVSFLSLGLINYCLSSSFIPCVFFQDLARWTDSGCRECECRDAQVTCYLLSCPTCPLGTLAITQEGGCCPECRQGRSLQKMLELQLCMHVCQEYVFCPVTLEAFLCSLFFLHLCQHRYPKRTKIYCVCVCWWLWQVKVTLSFYIDIILFVYSVCNIPKWKM